MRHEPIEISKANARRGQFTAPRAGRSRSQSGLEPTSKATAVIDEAFANFQSPVATTPVLVSNIAAQLRALDRQREHLAQLLRSVESSAISG